MRVLPGLAAAAVVAVAGLGAVALWMRGVESDPAEWHVDLASATRSGKPNDYLAACPGSTAAAPDRTLAVPDDPAAFLQALDVVALAEPRTRRLAGSPDEGRVTYVQRSALFAFPDYITVQSDAEGCALWSRSRFGTSDLGVNRARVERWLAAAGR